MNRICASKGQHTRAIAIFNLNLHLFPAFTCINVHAFHLINGDACACRLVSRSADVLDDDSLPNELLFGRAGFLWSLMFVQKHLGNDVMDSAIIPKVLQSAC